MTKQAIENRKRERQALTGKVIVLGMMGIAVSRLLPKDNAALVLIATMTTVIYIGFSDIFIKKNNPLQAKIKHNISFWEDFEPEEKHSPPASEIRLDF